MCGSNGRFIRIPSSKEDRNVKSFFSRHYRAYGINVQSAAIIAVALLRQVCMVSPGRLNNIAAYCESSLPGLIEKLPIGNYVIGDNAYVYSEHLLTPYYGNNKHDPTNDRFLLFTIKN
jgi:DDE superfamily endonuclease